MPDQRLGILIDGQYRAAAAAGQAIADQKRLAQALNEAKRAADGSAASNLKIGQLAVQHRRATEEARKAIQDATQATGIFSAAQKELASRLAASAGPLGRVVASLGGGFFATAALAAVGLGTAMVGLSRNVANVAEESENLQAQLGFTAEGVGALKVISGESGVAFETLSMAVNRLNVKVGEARQGNEDAAKAFRALGVSLNNSNGSLKTTEQLTSEVAQALLRVRDPAERARLSMETFGRGGTRGLKALASDFEEASKRAIELGVTMEGNVAASALKADQAFDRLATATSGLINSIGALSSMTITPLIEQFAKLAEEIAKAAKKFAESPWGRAVMNGIRLGPAGALMGGGVDVDSIIADFKAEQATTSGGGGGGKPDALAESIRLIEAQVKLQPHLLDAALKQLEAKKDTVEVEKELLAIQEAQRRLILNTPVGDDFIGPRLPRIPVMPTVTVQGQGTAMNQRPISGPNGENLGPLGGLDENKIAAIAQAAAFANKELDTFAESLEVGASNTEMFNASMEELGRGFVSTLVDGLANAIFEAKNLGEVLTSVVASAAEQLLAMAMKFGLNALFPGLGLLFSGGGRPVYASSGLVMNGVNGIDSVNARVHRGEMFVSHTDTQNLMRTVRQMDHFMKQQPSQAGDTYNITVNASGGDGQDWPKIARDDLIRALQRHQRLRTGRR